MKLADKPCYPTNHFTKSIQETGLTFRERLIVALAGNPKLVCVDYDISDQPFLHTDKTALRIIWQADAIIAKLEKENSNG